VRTIAEVVAEERIDLALFHKAGKHKTFIRDVAEWPAGFLALFVSLVRIAHRKIGAREILVALKARVAHVEEHAHSPQRLPSINSRCMFSFSATCLKILHGEIHLTSVSGKKASQISPLMEHLHSIN